MAEKSLSNQGLTNKSPLTSIALDASLLIDAITTGEQSKGSIDLSQTLRLIANFGCMYPEDRKTFLETSEVYARAGEEKRRKIRAFSEALENL